MSSAYNQFNYPSPVSSDVCANTPVSPTQSIASSLIIGHASSTIYVCSKSNTLCEMPVRQLFSADGRLFLEYKPGHNVVFVDNQISPGPSIQQALQQTVGTRRRRLPLLKREKRGTGMPKKPNNAFIRYRCRNLQNMRQTHPNASQTELSRIIAECWHNESPELKECLQAEYRSDLCRYHSQIRLFQSLPFNP
ncbi:hypothetical protein GGI20_004194 [Coemansia sp. BCRC 34301]|nr:hypothetical protein GGI20_004194 [Coemansia sp. BCRC 34301]